MATLTIPKAANSATKEEIQALFAQQQAFAPQLVPTTHKQRKAKIKKLLDYTMSHIEEIQEALQKDFQKTTAETLLSEILVIKLEAKHTMRHLKKWMKPKRVSMPLVLPGTSSKIVPEPKGTSLIISPWNYPFNLTIGPLISAIAAGNTAILKPSEMTPHTSALMRKMIEELFEPQEVCLVEGDVEVAQALLALPFNHIFFTGSPQVGKIVMKAAAEHLTSVTLELGGKSPVIVDESAKVKDAAEKVAWGKTLNNGQTCIAPDYVLVHEKHQDAFKQHYQAAMEKMFGAGEEVQNSDSYSRIVNARHFNRIKGLVEEAVENGANVAFGGQMDESENFIAPTLMTEVTDDMKIMQEEIFGPVLPMMTYSDKDEALRIINGKERPLSMYVMARNKKNADYFMSSVLSGDAVINDTLIHFSHPSLPFGGVNNSGIGKSGGEAGFKEFSHERSVLHQVYGTLKPFYPPYTNKVVNLIRMAVKNL
ncbi:MAG: aldehyde dehydrogenase family protein [Bacteroidota bacterium]